MKQEILIGYKRLGIIQNYLLVKEKEALIRKIVSSYKEEDNSLQRSCDNFYIDTLNGDRQDTTGDKLYVFSKRFLLFFRKTYYVKWVSYIHPKLESHKHIIVDSGFTFEGIDTYIVLKTEYSILL